MHIAIWTLAALGLALWTLLAWGLATLMGLDPGWVEPLKQALEGLPYRERLDQWLPGWQALTVAVLDLTRATLGWAAGFGTWLLWAVWAVGVAIIAAGAALVSLLVVLVRRSAPAAPPAASAAA